jgi:outer membrane protein
VIDANAVRNVLEIELNRVLNRPLEEPFRAVEETPEDVDLIANDPRARRFLGDPASFRILRNFLSQEAIAGSPELRQIDALIAAQRRALTSANNAFWVPEVALFATLDGVLAEGGAGVSTVPGTPILFPQTDDVAWALGLQLSYPLFTGLGRSAEKARASLELDDLTTQRAATAQRIEQFLRSTLHETGASYAGIRLSQDAAAAAQRNLDLVTDAYRFGRASVVDLIDAQSQSLIAELGVANSSYDFLIDVLRAERAIGRFSFFWTAAERDEFFGRLEVYEERVRGGNN